VLSDLSKGATGTGGGAGGRVICINRPVCVVGSQMPVHLPLSSAMVSRSHAMIVTDAEGVYVRDLASRNRLYVNGKPVSEADLGNSDVVRMGPFTFLCRSGFRAAGGTGQRRDGSAVRFANRKLRAAAGRLQMIDEHGGDPVPLAARTMLIGRRRGCDLLLNHPNVSPVHAIIFERSGRRFVRDLNSTAGTFVNGRKVRETELRGGEELRLGTAWLRYENDKAAAPPAKANRSAAEVGEDSAEELAAPRSIAATLEDLAAADDMPQGEPADQDELTAAEGLMAVAVTRQEDALADLATADDLFADVPEDVFRLRRAEAGQRRLAPRAAPATNPASVAAASPAPATERYVYTYETGSSAAPVAPLCGASDAPTPFWLFREWLGVRWLCRRLFGRPVTARSRPLPTSELSESHEVPTC
jgi:pSer/pThr/pTyr-binding forkhead associated (FHA) protein